jgi:Fur family transcriptional regulator, ferric uptake regulator
MTENIHLERARKTFSDYMQTKGLRKTPERFAILDEIYQRNDHFDVEDLFSSMKARKYRVSRATVYNTLDLLLDCNLVRKHQFHGNFSQYERSFGYAQHNHLVCNQCKRVTEFCDPRLHHIQTGIGELLEFEIVNHSFVLYGDCQKVDCPHRNEVPEAVNEGKTKLS